MRAPSGRQRVARTRAFLAEVATAEMESAFGQALASDLGREEDAPSYAKRLENALAHDSTEVLDDDLDLAPIDVKKTLDPRTPAYADAVLKELRFDEPE